ncbi:hypothetical protein HanHA89_Chr09g0332611 [Helianthus annuus]|nr:hypothetical protein HanHA89_Chr09g0332611 [Helianthus annuus]
MPSEYGAKYPQEGDTAADTPAGYVTMWANFFGDCNLWLPLTVFVAEILEWYKIQISQLSPFGVIRVRNFEYTFRALHMEPTVGDFRRFYQMTVLMGFFSFRQREGSPKLMIPPKGMTKWNTKFFYIKVAAICAQLCFRNVTDTIITEKISVPKVDTVDWFPRLRTIESKKLSNSQLWVLRMMLGRMSRKARPVVREKSGGFNFTIRANFQLLAQEAMEAELPQGKGTIVILGPCETLTPRAFLNSTRRSLVIKSFASRRKRISRLLFLLWCRRWQVDAAGAGEQKRPKLRRTRTAAISQPKPAVVTGKTACGDFFLF